MIRIRCVPNWPDNVFPSWEFDIYYRNEAKHIDLHFYSYVHALSTNYIEGAALIPYGAGITCKMESSP
jgi:hypothetical protein